MARRGGRRHDLRWQSQLDPIIRRLRQILSRAQVSLRGLDTSVAQEQLDLLQLPSRHGGTAWAGPPQGCGA